MNREHDARRGRSTRMIGTEGGCAMFVPTPFKLHGCERKKKFATVNILDGNLFSEKSYIKLGFVRQRRIRVFFRTRKLITNL